MNKKALFSAASATVLCSTMFAAPAMAQTTADIPSNIVASQSGSANVIGGSTTTKKVGDTVPVEWTVQGHPLLSSSNQGETIQHLYVYVPDVVKNVQITALSEPEGPNYDNRGYIYQSNIVDPAPAKYTKTRIRDYADRYREQNFYSTKYDESVTGKPGLTDNGWSVYSIALKPGGVSTFRITGQVTIESEETFVPIRAVARTVKCNGESSSASFQQGCQPLKTSTGGDMDGWAPDMPGPIFSLTDEEIIAQQKEQFDAYGIDGFTTDGCVATVGRAYDDEIPNDAESGISAGQEVVREYNLASSVDMTYLVPWGMEDGCDQAPYYINVEEPEEEPNNGDITIIDIDETNTHNETHIDNSDNSVTEDNSVTDNSETHITNNGTIINGDVYNNEYHFHGAPGVVPTAGDVIEIINNNENNSNAEGGNSESNAESNVDVDVNTGGTATDPETGEGDKPNDGQTPGEGDEPTDDQTPVNGDQPNEGQAPNEDEKDSDKDADKTPAGEVQAPSGEVKAPANGGTKVPSTSTTGGTNLADTSKTASQSKADAVSKSASPSRGATLANTGANGTTIASLIAAGILAIAAGAFMVRRNREV